MNQLFQFSEVLSILSAVAVGVSVCLALVPVARTSGSAVAVFVWHGICAVIGVLPKRKQTWGTVYDAGTKRPIPFAKVQLIGANGRVLETRIADRNGRYGFLATPDTLRAHDMQVTIKPDAKGYLFPSRTPASVDTFIYNNLYYGDRVTANDQLLINFDIPMDPVQKPKVSFFARSPSIAFGISVAVIADAGFWLGLFLVPFNFFLHPNPFTLGIVFLFLGVASLRVFGIREHPFGLVVDQATGRPMPFALLALNDASHKRVAFAVSDERGRYVLVVERGTYELAVSTPATVVPLRQARKNITARKGWITEKIAV